MGNAPINAPTRASLHTVAETARILRVSATRVHAMIAAGQLCTVIPAGAAYPRVTGASILAFASVAPETPVEVEPGRNPEYAAIYARVGL